MLRFALILVQRAVFYDTPLRTELPPLCMPQAFTSLYLSHQMRFISNTCQSSAAIYILLLRTFHRTLRATSTLEACYSSHNLGSTVNAYVI
jgi:hypothetical protein